MGLFVFISTILSAQVVLDLKDKISGLSISDAVIEAEVPGSHTEFYTTDEQGHAIIAAEEFPLSIFIQHLSYEREEIVIHNGGAHEIQLTSRDHHLNGIVVTGQYFAQSSKNSVYNIKSIDQEEIRRMAASDLAEVMSFSQNSKLERDQNLNGTYLKFLGMGGNTVKILLDGMPVSGRTALQFDLSQINLSNIEKIEIVEGPMSVEYGSNALAGVVNIITKKYSNTLPNLSLKWQEESIGSQYGFNKGVHNLAVTSNELLLKKVALTSTAEYKVFGGSPMAGENTRDTDWDPKKQLFGDVKVAGAFLDGEASYRLAYYRDWIDNLGPEEGPLRNRATDDLYKSRRWNQHISFGKYYKNFGRIDTKLSYSDFKRIKNTFVSDLYTGKQTMSSAEGAQDTSMFQNVSFWTHFTAQPNDRIKIKSGLDFQYDRTDGGRIIGNASRSAFDAALFTSVEFKASNRLTLRPGLRWAYNNRFKSPLVPSINALFKLSESSSLRGGYAKGFRAPALREMFFEFVDNSHTIFGNPNLTPEKSDFFDMSYVYTRRSVAGIKQKVSSRLFYTKVKNQITFAQDADDPTITTLLNNEIYKSYGFSVSQQLFFDAVEFSAGAGFIATYNRLSNQYESKKFVYTPEITAGMKVQIMDTPLNLNTQFKYNGQAPNYVLVNIPGETELQPELVKSDDFYIMDVMLNYQFSDRTTIGMGVKNLFNVQRIRIVNTGGIHSGDRDVPVGYGRSGFIRLNYNLKFNKKL